MSNSYNPIEWGKSAVRGVSDMFEGKPDTAKVIPEPPPAEGRPYPNLATVPPPPPRPSEESRARYRQEVAALSADRDAARAADQSLRDTGTLPPEPPKLAPVPTPAQSAATTLPPPGAPQPAAPPAPAAPSGVIVQRVGSLAFAPDSNAPAPVAREMLRQAAVQAIANAGRVRIVPAQVSNVTAGPEVAQIRTQAMMQTLTAAGLPAARITIAGDIGRRVDLYDVYVEH